MQSRGHLFLCMNFMTQNEVPEIRVNVLTTKKPSHSFAKRTRTVTQNTTSDASFKLQT